MDTVWCAFVHVTACLLQWHAVQQLERMWWFLLPDVFPGEVQPSPGCSIWCVSLSCPAQPWRARGITCLPSTDGGRWGGRYAGLGGKSRAVMREYIHTRENTLNALHLGLDFAIGKFIDFPQVSIGTDSVLPSEAETAASLMQVFCHIQIWDESVCTSFSLSALSHQKMNLACCEIHSLRYIAFVFVYNTYNA